MSRTINKQHLYRLKAQASEAKIQGLTKVAYSLEEQVNKAVVRDDKVGYTYDQKSLEKDINDSLWTAATRIADYLGVVADGRTVQGIVDSLSEELFLSICNASNTPDGVGRYEPQVPGENRAVIELEVEAED